MILFQAVSVMFMLFQSFFAAYYLGVSDFGAQMLALAPIFFGQAIFEPYIQTLVNSSHEQTKISIHLQSFFLVLAGIVFPVVLIGQFLGQELQVVLIATLIVYLAYTALLAHSFARRLYRTATQAGAVIFSTFVATFFFVDYALGAYQVIIANGVAFLLGSLYIFLRNRRDIEFAFVRNSELQSLWFEGVLFRLPVLFFSSVSLLILGLLGFSNSSIGEYRVFVSAVSAGRYFNLIPLPQLQVALSGDGVFSEKLRSRTVLLYISGVLSFSAAMVGLFPFFFEIFIGSVSHSRLALALGATFVLLQPLAYAVFWRFRGASLWNIILPVAILVLDGGAFVLFIFSGLDPFTSMGVVSALTVKIYVAVLYTSRAYVR